MYKYTHSYVRTCAHCNGVCACVDLHGCGSGNPGTDYKEIITIIIWQYFWRETYIKELARKMRDKKNCNDDKVARKSAISFPSFLLDDGVQLKWV